MSDHRKRPRDPNQLGKLIIDIATGQIEDRSPTPEEQGKDPAAVSMGRKAGATRAAKLTSDERLCQTDSWLLAILPK
jgi:hypothetical protein